MDYNLIENVSYVIDTLATRRPEICRAIVSYLQKLLLIVCKLSKVAPVFVKLKRLERVLHNLRCFQLMY